MLERRALLEHTSHFEFRTTTYAISRFHEFTVNDPSRANGAVFERIVKILDDARSRVARTINSAMVVPYWLIGGELVEEKQRGKKRAGYGRALLSDLSRQLNHRYGEGFSLTTLQDCRNFYLTYLHRLRIQHPLGAKLTMHLDDRPEEKGTHQSTSAPPKHRELASTRRPMGVESDVGFLPDLRWLHYRALIRVKNEEARKFYELQAARNQWDKRQFERQIKTLLFERLLKSSNRKSVLHTPQLEEAAETPKDIIKDPNPTDCSKMIWSQHSRHKCRSSWWGWEQDLPS